MADERDPHLTVGYQFGLVRLATSRGDGRMPNQLAKCSGALAQCGILQCLFEHGGAGHQLLAISPQQETLQAEIWLSATS